MLSAPRGESNCLICAYLKSAPTWAGSGQRLSFATTGRNGLSSRFVRQPSLTRKVDDFLTVIHARIRAGHFVSTMCPQSANPCPRAAA